MFSQIFKATLETLYMLLLSGFLSTLFGIPLGVGLYLCSRSRRLKTLYALLDLLVNIFRSIPFIILVLLLIPVTKNVMGTIIGPNAAIFNLTIAAMPFMARLSENSFNAVPSGIIDSSNSMGLNKWQMVTKVLIPETLPDQIGNITVLLINSRNLHRHSGSGRGRRSWPAGDQLWLLPIPVGRSSLRCDRSCGDQPASSVHRRKTGERIA